MHAKPTVAHINYTFFEKSETFVYQYISQLRNFCPVCLAYEFKNLDQFPLDERICHSIAIRRYSLEWFIKHLTRINRRVEDILKENKVRLLHAHFAENGVFAMPFRQRCKIPLVTSFYGFDAFTFENLKKWHRKAKQFFNEGDLFLAEGKHMRNRLIELGCPSDKIRIQRIAIPIDKIPFLERKPKKKDDKVIFMFSGRFEEKKGVMYALMALEKARARYSNFEFRLVGDGSMRAAVSRYITEHHMSDYVKMLGFLNYNDYLNEMQKADIFIHPSVTASNGNSEGGAPTTILEAQAMGMPVISSNHADIPNVVVPGESALLSDERDYDKLAENIIYLLANQDVWAKMGKTGRDFVQAYHDINREVEGLENIYESLIKP